LVAHPTFQFRSVLPGEGGDGHFDFVHGVHATNVGEGSNEVNTKFGWASDGPDVPGVRRHQFIHFDTQRGFEMQSLHEMLT
jgi:hypothetical protein